MRDTLPNKVKTNECAVVNLDSSDKPGTHWVAYAKLGNYCEYFDSFGDLKPPLELINYLKNIPIYYNYKKYQSFYSFNCGHFCIRFLRNFWKNHNIN